MARNQWFTAAEQTLPEHIPLPMEQLFQAGQAIQGRHDTNMGAIDATSTGLGSIEALAPAHRQYRDNLVNSYRQEVSGLLDRYNNNASDPQFTREIRRINNKYATDPNLATIRMGNESLKAKQKAIQDIYTKGGKYIDSNPTFIGADQNGNLTYDAGQVKMATFEKGLNDLFESAAKGVIDDGNFSTNKAALDSVLQSVVSGIGSNPITTEALQYYAQQGYTQEQAVGQLQNDIQRLYGSYLQHKKVDTNERLAIAKSNNAATWAGVGLRSREVALSERKYADEKAEKAFTNAFMLSTTDPIEAKNNNESLLSQTNNILNRFDSSGKMKEGKFQIANTPENRKRYPNAKIVSSSAGVGAPGQSFLQLDKAINSKEDKEFIQAAREVVDPNKKLTDKQALDAYKLYLQQDNNAPTFWNTPIKEANDNLTRYYAGNNGENLQNAYYVDTKGKVKRVADSDINLAKFKGFNFGGVTSSPINKGGNELTNGAVKITAVDDKGNPVVFYTQDETISSMMPISNLASKVQVAGLSNAQLRSNPEYIRQLGGMQVVPQRNSAGKVDFYQLQNGQIIGQPIDASEAIDYERAVLSNHFSRFKNK